MKEFVYMFIYLSTVTNAYLNIQVVHVSHYTRLPRETSIKTLQERSFSTTCFLLILYLALFDRGV